MKTKLFLLVGIFAILTETLFAQSATGGPEVLTPFMQLNYDPNSIETFRMKQLSDGVYGTGAVSGFSNNTPPANGQTISINGILWFPGSNLNNPQPVAGGIPTHSPNGVRDITETSDKLWAVANGADGYKLYSCDKANKTAWTPDVNFTSDSTPIFVEFIDDINLLLIGQMKTVCGVQGNGIFTYNTVTGVAASVGTGFSSPYNRPTHITRTKDGKICISGRTGIAIYDTQNQTFAEITGIGLGFYFGFLVHGDTMYTTGPDNNGSALYRKIGTGNWELLGYVQMGSAGTIVQVENKIVLLTATGCDRITYADGTVLTGSNFAFNETTNQFETPPVIGFSGLNDFCLLPTGQYLGWTPSAGLFSTPSLVSGVDEVNNNSTLSIYPNPAHSFVVIDGLIEGQDILITNSLGQTVLQTTATENKFVFNTQDIAPGMLFVNKTHKVFIN